MNDTTDNKQICGVCFHHCAIAEGQTGFCGARTCRNGIITALNYGRLSAINLDPIEKKPLRRFMPGTKVLSVGSFGCNIRCPFCQNSDISWAEQVSYYAEKTTSTAPEEIAAAAERLKDKGNIGVAFTYNEPLIQYEFVRDTAKLVHERGMKNVLVTNGTAELSVLEELAPFIDASNIDLKSFSGKWYRETLGGDLDMVRKFITNAVRFWHVELTTLIIPGENDSEEEMRDLSGWIAGLDPDIPLHVTRFFPRFRMSDRAPTDVETVYHLAQVAREKLRFVYTGNC